MSAVLYLEHLAHQDTGDRNLSELRREPDQIEALLRRPEIYTALFAPGGRSAFLSVSPFLIFAVLVSRTSQELGGTPFIYEWAGPGQRVPVFDVADLREFAADPLHRFFLAELLASYTKVASGSFWVQTSRGWRRRRFSELDPLRLIELLEVVPERERAGVYRRLGDLSLFLTGVFPDHTAERRLPPVERERLQRAVLKDRRGASDEPANALWLFETLGRRAYRMAWTRTGSAGVGLAGVLGDVADGFASARRILNFLTDRHLFPYRGQWFPLS